LKEKSNVEIILNSQIQELFGSDRLEGIKVISISTPAGVFIDTKYKLYVIIYLPLVTGNKTQIRISYFNI
jgi:hypothetical protein